jgi:RNA polymerase sigma-70 factor (ECF subfamily)
VNISDASDEELMLKIQNKDSKAFSIIVQRHSSKYYALAFRMLSSVNDAEDLVQNAFTKLWVSSDTWNPKKASKFTTWFYRVIVNMCLDHKRKYKTIYSEFQDYMRGDHDNTDHKLDQAKVRNQVEALIDSLPDRQKAALTLYFHDEFSQKEIATILETSVKGVESLLQRAKKNLKVKYDKEFIKHD